MVRISASCLAVLMALFAGPAVAEPVSKVADDSLSSGLDVAPAAKKSSKTQAYSLKRCLALAELNYPKVLQAEARRRQTTAQLDEARTAPFSDFSSRAGVALAPTVRGSNIFSQDTDIALSKNMALAWQVEMSGTVPLWTFGKITNLKSAAKAQVQIKQHEVHKAKNEVKLSVRRAYYGALFARDALHLLKEAQRRIDKHLGQLERAVEEGDADEVSLFEMRMHRAGLDARESEARLQERIALSGLKFLIGAREDVRVDDRPLPEATHRLAPLERYLSAARIFRPEVNMAKAGLVAREAQVRLARSQHYPDIGLTINAGWSQAPEVTDQLNPFVRDSANYLRYGAAIGARWKLDFFPQSARLAQAKATLEEMRATEQLALGAIRHEVEKAYAEARHAEGRLAAYNRAARHAQQWMITVQQGIDIGVYEEKDVVRPAKEYALQRFSQMNAVFEYNMALSRLALATGWDALAPEQ